MLVVGVQDEDEVEGLHDVGVELVVVVRLAEHHVQEVFAVGVLRLGVHDGHAGAGAVGGGCQRADFRDQFGGGLVEGLFVVHVHHLGLVARDGVDGGREDGHGVAVGREGVEGLGDAFVNHLVFGEQGAEVVDALLGGKLAVDQ